ncbi:MAG: hypothetical protein VX278_01715 [Myxococcota bacterium]|nr:hypothetical protein [Myxococcota bacterium]
MSTGGKQQRPTSKSQRDLLNEQQQLENALEQQREIEGLEEGQDFDADKAVKLQPNLGNQAVRDLMNKLNNVNNALSDLEQEGGDFEEDQQEELELEESMSGQSFGGGGGGGNAASGNPWETEFFYGGDDDPDPKKRKRKKRRRRFSFLQQEEPEEETQQSPPPQPLFSEIIPTPQQGERTKDAVYKAVEICLQDPYDLFGQSLDPQELLKRKGFADPIRCPIEIGRFLTQNAQNSMSRSLSELVGEPASPLLSPQGGFSTAVARLATIAICAEAAEGGKEQTDRAVALSLRHDAWFKTVKVAKQLSQKGQLHAPTICAQVTGDTGEEDRAFLPTPSLIGGAGLKHVMPHPPAISAPYLALPVHEEEITDELVNMIDKTLAILISGKDPEEEKILYVDYSILQPALNSANSLLGALGRTQVEFAAAAVAVKSIYTGAPIISTLKHSDSALRQLAQATVQAGRTLENLRGLEIEKADEKSSAPLRLLSETINALRSLRRWGFSTIAGSLEKH